MKIYTVGDSHSIVYHKSELVDNFYWLGGMTMHRVGTKLINFNNVECDPLGCGKEIKSVPTDGIIIASFGEIDVRNHIYKHVCMGRNEDEIICTLVNNYIEALKLNNILYKSIACASIVPVRKDFENEQIPVKGTNEDRLRYTLKLNYLLNLQLPKHGFYFLNLYPYYCNSDGYLIDDDKYRDSSVHLQHSTYMDEELKKMIIHFKNTENINGFYNYKDISLHELGLKYNTNKAFYHNYCKFYDKILLSIKDSCKKMLEVGISDGASIFMWRDYLKNATIYGIDIQPECLIKNQERIISGLGDQSNVESLKKLVEEWNSPEFDFIIDDGSHIVSHQQNTINSLWRYVKKGGMYIIEDLHTNIVENFYTHPHLNPSILLKYLDSPKTVHNNIIETMGGNSSFSFNDEIEDIYYFYNQPTKSLSCVFVKKA